MINRVILQGRLTATPELKHTQSNKPVTSFTLAVDRSYKQENGPTADFINCVAWGLTAEFITKFFYKGQEMLAEGEIQTRTYTDQQGVKKYITEVRVGAVHFCGPKQQAGQQDTAEQDKTTETEPASFNNDSADDFTEIDENDDLPF